MIRMPGRLGSGLSSDQAVVCDGATSSPWATAAAVLAVAIAIAGFGLWLDLRAAIATGLLLALLGVWLGGRTVGWTTLALGVCCHVPRSATSADSSSAPCRDVHRPRARRSALRGGGAARPAAARADVRRCPARDHARLQAQFSRWPRGTR